MCGFLNPCCKRRVHDIESGNTTRNDPEWDLEGMIELPKFLNRYSLTESKTKNSNSDVRDVGIHVKKSEDSDSFLESVVVSDSAQTDLTVTEKMEELARNIIVSKMGLTAKDVSVADMTYLELLVRFVRGSGSLTLAETVTLGYGGSPDPVKTHRQRNKFESLSCNHHDPNPIDSSTSDIQFMEKSHYEVPNTNQCDTKIQRLLDLILVANDLVAEVKKNISTSQHELVESVLMSSGCTDLILALVNCQELASNAVSHVDESEQTTVTHSCTPETVLTDVLSPPSRKDSDSDLVSTTASSPVLNCVKNRAQKDSDSDLVSTAASSPVLNSVKSISFYELSELIRLQDAMTDLFKTLTALESNGIMTTMVVSNKGRSQESDQSGSFDTQTLFVGLVACDRVPVWVRQTIVEHSIRLKSMIFKRLELEDRRLSAPSGRLDSFKFVARIVKDRMDKYAKKLRAGVFKSVAPAVGEFFPERLNGIGDQNFKKSVDVIDNNKSHGDAQEPVVNVFVQEVCKFLRDQRVPEVLYVEYDESIPEETHGYCTGRISKATWSYKHSHHGGPVKLAECDESEHQHQLKPDRDSEACNCSMQPLAYLIQKSEIDMLCFLFSKKAIFEKFTAPMFQDQRRLVPAKEKTELRFDQFLLGLFLLPIPQTNTIELADSEFVTFKQCLGKLQRGLVSCLGIELGTCNQKQSSFKGNNVCSNPNVLDHLYVKVNDLHLEYRNCSSSSQDSLDSDSKVNFKRCQSFALNQIRDLCISGWISELLRETVEVFSLGECNVFASNIHVWARTTNKILGVYFHGFLCNNYPATVG